MTATVSAQGYTSVIMVMNLNRFIHQEDRDIFHSLRGTHYLRDAIQEQWLPSLLKSPHFSPVDEDFLHRGKSERMSTLEVGFATGVFRQYLLENHMCPTYRVNKAAYHFPPSLEHNFQFRRIFLPVWKRWEIFVRPSVLGVLIIRLTRTYEKATPLEQLTSDVIRLQSPFDIPSALKWLERLKKDLADDAVAFQEKEQSVQELLHWLGSDVHDDSERLDYSPVQWQLAMEISNLFVKAVGATIEANGYRARLRVPSPVLSHPLHDSYVIHHVDKLYASPSILPSYHKKQKSSKKKEPLFSQKRLVQVGVEDLWSSITVKQKLLNMLEGALLRSPTASPQKEDGNSRFFPYLKPKLLDDFPSRDLATWYDELCVMSSRVALMMPSASAQKYNLFISTLPISITTSSIRYPWYWDTIDRMIEFVSEVRVLSQIIEHSSTRLLQQCVELLHRQRRGIVEHVPANKLREFKQIITQTANLSRLLAIAQTLNNPSTWSRAEFATTKAQHLLDEFSVPQSLQHAAENITNLNALLEHLDELLLIEDSAGRERKYFWVSVAFASLSMLLTILILPSFWADLNQLPDTLPLHLQSYAWLLNLVGTILALSMILVVLLLGFGAILFFLVRMLRASRKVRR